MVVKHTMSGSIIKKQFKYRIKHARAKLIINVNDVHVCAIDYIDRICKIFTKRKRLESNFMFIESLKNTVGSGSPQSPLSHSTTLVNNGIYYNSLGLNESSTMADQSFSFRINP